MFTYIELNKGRRDRPRSVAAHLPGVRVELAKKATQIGMVASGILDSHSGQSYRLHDLPSPTIKVEGHDLDWYVWLQAEADSEGEAEARAVGIEFGHRYQPKETNPSGPWGASGGLGVLRRAVDFVDLMG